MASAEAEAAFGDPRVYIERYVSPAGTWRCRSSATGSASSTSATATARCSAATRSSSRKRRPRPARAAARATAPGGGRARQAPGVCGGGHRRVPGRCRERRGAFYFLEVNARIQVEHPSPRRSRAWTWSPSRSAIAEGRPLRLQPGRRGLRRARDRVPDQRRGPGTGFLPSPGTVTGRDVPGGSGHPGGTHIQAGAAVPPHYDSLLAKVISHGEHRGQALSAMLAGLARCQVTGWRRT